MAACQSHTEQVPKDAKVSSAELHRMADSIFHKATKEKIKRAIKDYKPDDSLKMEMNYWMASHSRPYAMDSSLSYSKTAFRINRAQKIDSRLPAIYLELGHCYPFLFDSGYYYFQQAITASKKIRNKSALGHSYLMTGFTLEGGMNTSSRESENNVINGAGEYMDSAACIFNELHDTLNLIDALSRKTEVYVYTKQLAKAGESINQAMNIVRQSANKNFWSIYITKAYYHTSIGEYDSALVYYQTPLDISKTKDKYDAGYVYLLSQISICYAKLGMFDKAIGMALKGYKLSSEAGLTKEKQDNITSLYEIYKTKKDFGKALYYYEKLFTYSDSVNATKLKENMSRFNLQIEAEKNREKITLLQKDKELELQKSGRQRAILFALLGGLLLLIILALVIYNRYLLKQKANAELSKTLIELKETQAQLLKAEKLAAIANVASRVAHEIQNPLNFVTNFSGLSLEIIEDLRISNKPEDIKKLEALNDYLNKINHHGIRASDIINQLSQHTRTGTAEKFFEEK